MVMYGIYMSLLSLPIEILYMIIFVDPMTYYGFTLACGPIVSTEYARKKFTYVYKHKFKDVLVNIRSGINSSTYMSCKNSLGLYILTYKKQHGQLSHHHMHSNLYYSIHYIMTDTGMNVVLISETPHNLINSI